MAKPTRRSVSVVKEKTVLMGMILSDEVLRQVQFLYQHESFQSAYATMVADWCLTFFREYGRAPGRDIQTVYYQKMDHLETDVQDLVEGLLVNLSDEYERVDKLNVPYILDTAEKFFKSAKVKGTATRALEYLASDELVEAERELVNFTTVARPTSSAINPYTDEDAIRRAFSRRREPLFEFDPKEAFGKMVNRQLHRGGFVALMGIEKIGKTWMLDLFGHQAARCRCNVAFFSVGDMDEEDMVLRKATGLCRKPTDPDWINVDIPWPKGFKKRDLKDYEDDQGDTSNFGCSGWDIVYENLRFSELLTADEAIRAGRNFSRRLKGKDYKLFTFPNDTVNVQFIKAQLDVLEATSGWIPDVIIIDYADILCPEPSAPSEFRHQQNTTWKRLRALAQERHCLVITATQADSAAYATTATVVRRGNFSEDKRKLSHVTAMLGLNQTDAEKRCGVMRVNWVVVRHGFFAETLACYLLQCLPLGRPLISSAFIEPKASPHQAATKSG